MWKSELHLVFLGFRGKGGVFLVNLFESKNSEKTYATPLKSFLKMFSGEHLGWIYKLTSHFIFQGPMAKTFSYESIKSLIEKDDDTLFYIKLAEHHIREALIDHQRKETFFCYIRQFAHVMYSGRKQNLLLYLYLLLYHLFVLISITSSNNVYYSPNRR